MVDTPSNASTLHEAEEHASVNKEKIAQDGNAGKQEQDVVEEPADVEKVAQQGKPQGFTFPDGGLWAWAAVVAGWLTIFVIFGMVNTFGVFQEYYQTVYIPDKSSSDIAWVGSFQIFLQFAMGIVTGKLFDEGYFHYILAIGSVIWVVGFMMVSLAKDYYSIFLAQGLALGIANGLLFLPAVGLLAHYFQKKRALATGIVISGSSIGGVVLPIALNQMFHNSIGFEWGVRIVGFIGLGCLLIANLISRTRLPPRKKRPAFMQVEPDFKGIITDKAYLIMIAGAFCAILSIFYPLFYIQVFAVEHNIDPNIAFYTLSILNAASTVGRVLPNFLADKFGAFNMMIPSLLISAAFIFIFLACTNSVGIIFMSIFYGCFSGAYVSLLPAVIGGFARGVHEIGVRLGLAFFICSFGALLGTPISGWLLGPEMVWWKASAFAGAIMLFGTFLFAISRQMESKRRNTQKL